MDHYPEVKISEREYPTSRHDSASSIPDLKLQHSPPTQRQRSNDTSSRHSSFSDPAQHQSHDSIHINTNGDMDVKSHSVEAEYKRYIDAPPPYSEKAYEGKSEEEQTNMRMKDYARELSRIMGRQLVKDLKTIQSEEAK